MLQWLNEEWIYADTKFDDQRKTHDAYMQEESPRGGWWENQVYQYLSRASVLGMDNPLGRQALIKMLAAMTGMIESMIRVHGLPPKPGVPSGEVQ